jgi:hypothetical protein
VKNASPDAAIPEVQLFAIDGECLEIHPHRRGHIHNTFISTWMQGGSRRRYLHQQLNSRVFTDIPALMHNVRCVTQHLAEQTRNGHNPNRFRTLQLVPTRLGRSFLVSPSGHWRTYEYVENTESHDQCAGPEQAYAAALAFGDFQAQLIDLDIDQLRETIPNFFSSPFRLRQFDDALDSDPRSRAAIAGDEIRFIHARRSMVQVIDRHLELGAFPARIVHGDTKLNNVLFDRDSGEAVCVVDLDTCMPAYSLYDFGDLVRFTAATSREDETDLAKAGTDLELYRALVNGYLDGASGILTPLEIELMPFAARLVTFTIGMRFLTDYLAGDVYFKTDPDRPDQNLDRARVQFRMVEFMEGHEREMAAGPKSP